MTFNDYVSPACILRDNSKFHGQNCFVAGWGDTQTGADAEILQSVNVKVDMNECWGDMTNGQICASEDGKEQDKNMFRNLILVQKFEKYVLN